MKSDLLLKSIYNLGKSEKKRVYVSSRYLFIVARSNEMRRLKSKEFILACPVGALLFMPFLRLVENAMISA